MGEAARPARATVEEPTRKQFSVLVEAIASLVGSTPDVHTLDADPRGIAASAGSFSRAHPDELKRFLEAARAVPGFRLWWEPVACLTEVLAADVEACLVEMARLEAAAADPSALGSALRSFGESWAHDRPVRLARAFVFAARDFVFSAPLAVACGTGQAIELGGGRRLRLVFPPPEAEGTGGTAPPEPRVTLDGSVRAMSFPAAAAAATELAEAVLGLGAVLGLFEVTRFDPSRRHDVRTVLSLCVPPGEPRPYPIRGPYLDATLGARTVPPAARSAPDRARAEAALRKVAVGAAPRAEQLRSAARFFLQGVASDDAAQSVLSLFTCLEATLLEQEKNEAVTARLTEAVAFRLGRSASDRDALRRRLKRLYDFRSRVVHQGERTIAWESLEELVALVRAVLARELEELEEEDGPEAG